MKRINYRLTAFASALLGALLFVPNTFADNPYGINYSGGTELGASNVQINPTLVNELAPLIKYGTQMGNRITASENGGWKEGYINTNNCSKAYYLEYPSVDGGIKVASNRTTDISPSYTISNNDYSIVVKIDDVFLDGITEESLEGKSIAVAASQKNGGLHVGYKIYTDDTCKTVDENIKGMNTTDNGKVFVETNIKLYKNGTEYVSNGLYFGLVDIDAAQSYKILNEGDSLKASNMYAESAAKLQPTDSSIVSRNRFNASSNYIYSEYIDSGKGFNIETSGNDIFVKLSNKAQTDGLNMVFGFVGSAGSGVQYYAKQFVVKYISDDNGKISGIGEEDIIASSNPSGSASTPNSEYKFVYWIADIDVTLEDGTVIKKGEKMTLAQVKQVVVDQDITFTAIHETEDGPAVPNTGSYTSEGSLMPIAISITGVALGAMIIGLLPKLHHKRIDFNK